MKNDQNNQLKLRIRIQDQQMTLWKIIKQEPTYIMFNASITSGKKNSDGTWDNINQPFTCFANTEAMKTIVQNKSADRAKIKVSGSITMLPEKRTAMGRNGEYQETIFSNPTINIDTVEFLSAGETQSGEYQKADDTYSKIDDDIPF
jgi:hypothetical protein